VTFEWPLALLLLLLVPLAIAGYLLIQRRRITYAARFTNLDLLANVVERSPGWRRHLPAALALAALAALFVALARPQASVARPRSHATVVLALDISGSMSATDVQPTRLAAAKEAARNFLDQLPKSFRVGVVSFSTTAQVVAPATDDRELVRAAIAALQPSGGTAIGDAIVRSVQVGRAAQAAARRGDAGGRRRPFSILLLSDGANTSGVDPLDGSARAKKARAPVYTIALGTQNGVVQRLDEFGNLRTIPVPPDPDTLRQVAEQTGGRFFEAPSEGDLKDVYERLGTRVGFVQERHELTYAFAAGAAALLLAAGTLSALWFNRIP
jgi:Ca-activated chloride channel family protein